MNMETLTPMPGRILIRPDDDPKTLGRLILPDAVRKKAKKGLTGTVHSVGEGCDLNLRGGDRVIYLWAGYNLKNCRLPEEYAGLVVLKPESILARLINVDIYLTCPICNGSGMPNGVSGYPCPECGSGAKHDHGGEAGT